jgi:hypothetical protein
MAPIRLGVGVAVFAVDTRVAQAIAALIMVFTLITDAVFSVVVTHIFMKVRTLQSPRSCSSFI